MDEIKIGSESDYAHCSDYVEGAPARPLSSDRNSCTAITIWFHLLGLKELAVSAWPRVALARARLPA